MSRKSLMSWEASPHYRWVKMFKGIRYRVSCNELGIPPALQTNWVNSYQAANDWWLRKRAELGEPTVDQERQEELAAIEAKLAWAAEHDTKQVPTLKAVRQNIIATVPGELVLNDADTIAQAIEAAKLVGIAVPADLDPMIAQQLFGNGRIWAERFSKATKAPKDKTIGQNQTMFLELEQRRIKPQSYRELRWYLTKVQEAGILPTAMGADKISEATVNNHYLWLSSQQWGNAQKNKYLGFFRRFVQWLWTMKLLPELPRNLKVKSQRFKVVPKPIAKFDNVANKLAALPERFRLWALLALNCGMTQADLGELTWEMIDWQTGTLSRRRVKTKTVKQVPIVTYKLFPETLQLLKKLKARTGLVFKSKDGKPLYETWYVVDQEKKKDMFSTYWNRLTPKPGITLGKFRSIGATILKQKTEFRGFVELFLGHAATTIADIHYAAESDGPFFQALAYIRSIAVVTKKPKPK